MSRQREQELILERMKGLYLEKGSLETDDVYDMLTSFNLTEADKTLIVKKNIFDIHGETKKRGIILNDEDVSFIPIASSLDCGKEKGSTALKMYLSVDAKHLKKTYEKLNDFMKKNNIQSSSKARNRASSDDIVMRIPDIKDIEKVKNFIKNDSYIREAIKNTNPFFARDELGISYSQDGMHSSVNDQLSSLLADYFNSNKDNLDSITRDGFKNYLHTNKTEFYKKFDYAFPPENVRIANLLELSMDEEFSYEDMIRYNEIIKSLQNKNVSIRDIINTVYTDLLNTCGEQANELIVNIDNVHESLYSNTTTSMLAKLYLSNDLVEYYANKEYNNEENKSL